MCRENGMQRAFRRKEGTMKKLDPKGWLIRRDIAKSERGSGDAALAVGRSMIQAVMDAAGLNYDEAAQQLLSGGMPSGVEALSANAAKQLAELAANGRIAGDVEEYIKDPDFIALLSEMPAASAVRVYESELEKRELRSAAEGERRLGEQDVIEKLLSRRVLPQSTRVKAPSSADADYYSMDTDEFNRLRERRKRSAR